MTSHNPPDTLYERRDPAPSDRADVFAAITRVVFQSGMGRSVVDAKWDGIVDAFDGLDPASVAHLGPEDVERLCGDPRVIRNRRKIEAIIRNAQRLLEIDATSGIGAWIVRHEADDTLDRALRGEFAFVGPAGVEELRHRLGLADGPECER